MLDRLRPGPVVGGHDEQGGVDLAGSDEHVADEPVVTGHVDEVELGPVVEGQVGVADVDRHPAPALLGEAVRVDPGERSQEARLAVVDVAGRPDDDGHRPGRIAIAAASARARSSSRVGSTVRRSSTTWPAWIRPTIAGRPSRSRPRSAADPGTATPHDASVSPGSDAAPDGRIDAPRRAPRAPDRRAGPPAPRPGPAGRPAGRRSSARRGSRGRPARPGTGRASRRARRASSCRAGSPGRAGRVRSRATRSARPTMSPACGPPTSLSPLNVTRSAPAASRSRGVGSWARPKPLVSRRAPLPRSSTTSAPWRWASSASAGGSGASTKPSWRKFEGWTRSTSRAIRRRGPARSRRPASGSSSRPRRVARPARRTISGIRTPPPISTSSPRDTTTRPPRPASPTASASAAALLLATSASSAPVSAMRCSSAARKRAPRRPVRSVELEEERLGGGGPGGLDRGPRPGCPAEVRVDDHAGRVDDARRAGPDRVGEGVEPGDERGGEVSIGRASSPAASRARSSSMTARASARTASWSRSPSAGSRRGEQPLDARWPARGRSDAHRRHRRTTRWRERMGVEPTASRRAWRHRF